MFGFMDMVGNLDERKVDRYETEEMCISTVMVTDGRNPYETAIHHPSYNGDSWVIVEGYPTTEKAQKGHDSWVKIMTSEDLPDKLVDCANADISQLCEAIGAQMEFPKEA